jgi:hypothetical protein
MQNTEGRDKETAFLKNYLQKLPKDKWAQINAESEHVSEMLLLAAGKFGGGIVGQIGGFLGGLFPQKEQDTVRTSRSTTIGPTGDRTDTVKEETTGRRPRIRRR